eukprot:CAMPEP_0117083928 /NCGR_PEP_ID=MMETSP0472-20121206/59081_1 /TAXON_ID=693140 ORGANISM="Tiarina fusus, Strain LIS" /NCGR_SAMPLE_ID=MMETSP0472 /ASSEMBLY_ACC=CAM_ASM_000603 /LENGTH=252 /DNA_ID=CAMNT_0004812733 /DNA_START=39 /DNA_END=795 /DNA_ORIENTATION=+
MTATTTTTTSSSNSNSSNNNNNNNTGNIITVGIDIGSESTKVVLGSRHGCEIVRNDVGGHTMPTAVSFSSSSSSSSSCRHIGATAQTKNAVLGLTRLLPGEVDTTVNDNDALIFGKFEINHDDNTVNGMDYHSGSTTTTTSLSSFSASALLAMLLGKVRSNVESTLARITTGDSNNNNNNNNNNTGDQEDHDAKMKVDYILEFDIVVPPETSTEARIGFLCRLRGGPLSGEDCGICRGISSVLSTKVSRNDD